MIQLDDCVQMLGRICRNEKREYDPRILRGLLAIDAITIDPLKVTPVGGRLNAYKPELFLPFWLRVLEVANTP